MDIQDNTHIMLTSPHGAKWHSDGRGFARGYAFVNGIMYRDEELTEYCSKAIESPDCNALLSRMNGCFAVIVRSGNSIHIVSDKMRSIPLLYRVQNGHLHVTDSGETMLSLMSDVRIDMNHAMRFAACGHLRGGETLVKGCHVTAPASVTTFANGQISTRTYSSRLFDKHRVGEDYMTECKDIIENMAARMIQAAEGRTIVIPLSGGYDSRLIACMCRMYGAKNVICYTYGTQESREAQTAKSVAEKLNYPIHFIKSTPEKWQKLTQDGRVRDYLAYGGYLSMVAHLQDFFAVSELKSSQLIPDNSVIVPGHTGDLLAGNHFLYGTDKDNIQDKVYDKYYVINILGRKYKRDIKEQLRKELEGYADLSSEEGCYEAIYQWNINNRQPNYIINSVRAYEYFGYSWLIPLWDDSFVRFWSGISCVQRKEERLYERFLLEKLFSPLGVDYLKDRSVEIQGPLQKAGRYMMSADTRYLMKKTLARLHLYRFPNDNALLNIAAGYIRDYGQYTLPGLIPREEDSMSAKSLYYLSHIAGYGKE